VRKQQGLFITFEGTEGAGKSTLIRQLAKSLQVCGHSTTVTREPGGSKTAEAIREIILKNAMPPWTELFLYEAARADHMSKVILPALERGGVVLCDRFTDSTLAYQGYARGLPWKQVQALNKIATMGRTPDLTVLLDIDPAFGLRRAREQTRFEAEGVEFQSKVRKGFLKSRAENPRRWLTLNAASGTPEELAEQVIKRIAKRLPKKGQKKRG
jgi:dTMP kinase